MSNTAMRPIEPLRIHAVQLAHTFGKVAFHRLDQKMVVVIHQTIGVDRPIEALADLAYHSKEHAPIAIIQEHRFLPVTSRGDVIQGACVFNA